MILRKKKKNFEQPNEGSHLAVLADIGSLGEKVTPWGQQDQLRWRWFVQQIGKDGRQLSVIATYNNSLNENSNLVQVITDLTGTPPDDGFDTETLIGANARLTIKHHVTQNGSVFPKIVAILPPGKNEPVLQIPGWYKRTASGDKTPSPASDAATSPAKAALQRAAANSKAVASAPPAKQVGDSELPPEPHDLDTDDDATSFPGNDATSDENAA